MNAEQLRQEYMRAGLAEDKADRDPLRQFEAWMAEAIAAGLPLPNAMTLATAAADGTPSARIVLLKGADRDGFVFYTNYLSRKGEELGARAGACLLFFWPQLERQVRIEGSVEKVTPAESDAYYATRPLGARFSAWASPQSRAVASRAALEQEVAAKKKQYGEQPPRPPHWGGYRLRPAAFEFWQGRADRLHDRLLYSRAGDGWKIGRLAP